MPFIQWSQMPTFSFLEICSFTLSTRIRLPTRAQPCSYCSFRLCSYSLLLHTAFSRFLRSSTPYLLAGQAKQDSHASRRQRCPPPIGFHLPQRISPPPSDSTSSSSARRWS